MTTSLKTCFKCAAEKPRTEFYAHKQMADGLLGKCKTCCRKDVSENRAANWSYYSAFDRERANLPHRVKQRDEYQKSTRGRIVKAKSQKRYLERWPGKRAAHSSVSNALRDGRMARPDCCSSCGCSCKPEAHHCDYAKPLEVMWLCKSCHVAWHLINKPLYLEAA